MGLLVTHAVLGVVGELLVTIELLGRARQHLAYPVGYDGEAGGVRELGHALESPSSEIRHDRLLGDKL
jgi:hypothetical protein